MKGADISQVFKYLTHNYEVGGNDFMSANPVRLDPFCYKVALLGVFSRGLAPQSSKLGSATGFFFQKENEKYLITNRHVLINELKQFFPDLLKFEVHTSRTTTTLRRIIEVPLYSGETKIWFEHPDNDTITNPEEKIDLAAIKINDFVQTQDAIDFFTQNDLPSTNLILNLGDSCVIIGYPHSFHDRMHYLPIARSGSLASNWGAYFNGKKYFLIDSKLHPGTSGSPILLPSATARTDANGPGIGFYPPVLLGINSGEFDNLNLNIGWYSQLLPEII